jgi:putative ABC transport system permease protein
MAYRPEMNLVVRSDSDPRSLLPAIRNELAALDKSIPLFNVRTLEEQVQGASAQEHTAALVTSMFGGLALLLAIIGLYGVMSYSVMQRTREIGIRMALGASRGNVLRLVVQSGMKLVLAGVVIGIGAAVALTQLIGSLLYGVTPTDLLTYLSVAVGLAVVALVACCLPARRAAKVDPLVALRYE